MTSVKSLASKPFASSKEDSALIFDCSSGGVNLNWFSAVENFSAVQALTERSILTESQLVFNSCPGDPGESKV